MERDLLVRYFRQQLELSLPDLVLQQPLAMPFAQARAAKGATVDSKPQPVKPAPTLTPPAAATRPKASFTPAAPSKGDALSRLSRLKPIEQVHILVARDASTPRPEVDPMPLSRPMSLDEKRSALKELFFRECSNCHLAATRTKYVFGSGNANAPLMVIGEAPGAEEDQQGLPFVGAAGQLLTDMLKAINLDRKNDTFIANVLKCRPPQNRNPESAEIVACMPILEQQIRIIQPKMILLLGRIAAHAVLGKADSIARLRGQAFEYKGIPAAVTYHPAALLRNAEYKRPAWEDLKRLQVKLQEMGVYAKN